MKLGILRRALPLALRKPLAIWLDRQQWLERRHEWSMGAIRDLADTNPHEFHAFLWSNHIAYAPEYESVNAFGADRLLATRRIIFEAVEEELRRLGSDPRRAVTSVFDVGCSMGHLLNYLEDHVVPSATVLEGIDIDRTAIEAGRQELARRNSKVRLAVADMVDLAAILDGRRFDLIISLGTLIYLPEEMAAAVVRTIIEHASQLVALSGIASPRLDNRDLERSERRQDGAYYHNLDRMAEEAGGSVVRRRCDGVNLVDGYALYMVICRPPDQ